MIQNAINFIFEPACDGLSLWHAVLYIYGFATIIAIGFLGLCAVFGK